MKLLVLHDSLNPVREIPMDAEDFSMAYPAGSGAAVKTKSSDQPVFVHETPEQVTLLLKEVLQ